MKIGFVIPVSDVDAPVPGYGMRVNGLGRSDAVLPLLLHLSVHHQQRVMREVDSNLALCVAISSRVAIVIILGYYSCSQRPDSQASHIF